MDPGAPGAKMTYNNNRGINEAQKIAKRMSEPLAAIMRTVKSFPLKPVV